METKWSEGVVDRAVGAVVGSALGDAMGAPYEFGPPRPDAPCELEGGGGFGWAPGEWTDDTQMALAILGPLAARGPGEPVLLDAIDAAVQAWFSSGPRDVGNQTRAVLGAAAQHGSSATVAALAYQAGHPDAAGNGALMRTGPVALAHLGDRAAVASLARSVAAMTHPHPDSVDACVLWSLALERAITTATAESFDWVGSLQSGLEFVDEGRRAVWAERIDEAAGADPVRWSGSNGWVVGAFQAAMAAITSTPVPTDRPTDHLVRVLEVASRSGGDTDTVAAIAGALLGARWGVGVVPEEWRSKLNGYGRYDQPKLSGADLERLAQRAVGAAK